METSLAIDTERSIVRAGLSGLFSVDEFLAFYEALMADPRFEPDMTVVWDARALILAGITVEKMRQIGDCISRFGAGRHAGKAAWVSGNDLGFGMVKLFAMQNHRSIPAPLQIFLTLDEAEEWANIRPQTPTGAPRDPLRIAESDS